MERGNNRIITVQGTELQEVHFFKYLGSTITKDGMSESEIRTNMASTRS